MVPPLCLKMNKLNITKTGNSSEYLYNTNLKISVKENKMNNNLPAVTEEWTMKEFGWTKSQFEVVHNTYFRGMTMDDIKIFGHVCKHTGLDPFLKQIYPVMRQNKLTIQTAIDGYRAIAERTKRYSPGREPSFTYNKDGAVFGATAYVKKMTEDGTWHEVAATAYFSEYNPGVGPFWKKMPHAMISKCAEALALRKAFPDQLSGVYTKEEMDQAGSQDIPKAEYEEIKHNPGTLQTITMESPKEILEPKISFEDMSEFMKLYALTNDIFKENFDQYIKKSWNVTELENIPAKYFDVCMTSMARNIESRQV